MAEGALVLRGDSGLRDEGRGRVRVEGCQWVARRGSRARGRRRWVSAVSEDVSIGRGVSAVSENVSSGRCVTSCALFQRTCQLGGVSRHVRCFRERVNWEVCHVMCTVCDKRINWEVCHVMCAVCDKRISWEVMSRPADHMGGGRYRSYRATCGSHTAYINHAACTNHAACITHAACTNHAACITHAACTNHAACITHAACTNHAERGNPKITQYRKPPQPRQLDYPSRSLTRPPCSPCSCPDWAPCPRWAH